MQNSQSLLDHFPEQRQSTLSKKAFAEHVGVTQGRISQLIKDGLPVEPNGRIHAARGVDWMRQNIDPNRRRASLADVVAEPVLPGALITPRAKRDAAEAEISRLKAERLAGRLIDRRATLRVIEGRAKTERDAWIGWVNRVAPILAAAVKGDLSAITGVLDREVREQLVTLSQQPVDLPK